ncbi:cell division protein ZapB [Streptomyces sp. NPDC006267]|uniref:cell division protein ZapB n=1 Tax=Streptomyces sp. NPDC006267 TaxID=3157173 RepID=UPI0033AB2F8C
MTDTPMTPDVAAVQQAAIRAIHALKSPTPDGSRHYQSGWDDGLEAAIDAARDSVEGPARTLLAEVDRLRKALSDAADQVAELEDGLGQASAENAALRERLRKAPLHGRALLDAKASEEATATHWKRLGIDPAEAEARVAELAEGLAGLEAMRREHPAPCRVPDSPDCTCLDEAALSLCGKTVAVNGNIYAPCARHAGHSAAYCRDSAHNHYFLAADTAGPTP